MHCHSLESWGIRGTQLKEHQHFSGCLFNLCYFKDIEVILQESKLTHIQKADLMQVLWDLVRVWSYLVNVTGPIEKFSSHPEACTCTRGWQLAAIAASKFLEMSVGHFLQSSLLLDQLSWRPQFPAEFAACCCTGFNIKMKILMGYNRSGHPSCIQH